MEKQVNENDMPMLKYQKYNGAIHTYEPYYVPVDKKLRTYCEDFDTIINCCQCLKPLKYGDSYCSKEVHDSLGMGYAVCSKCYDEEWERRRKWEQQWEQENSVEK